MPMPTFDTVDDYIAAQPEPIRPALETARAGIRKALPNAEETITKNPAYEINGKTVLFLSAFKAHFGIFPVPIEIVETLGDELPTNAHNGKGMLRFPYKDPVPTEVIQKTAKLKADRL